MSLDERQIPIFYHYKKRSKDVMKQYLGEAFIKQFLNMEKLEPNLLRRIRTPSDENMSEFGTFSRAKAKQLEAKS